MTGIHLHNRDISQYWSKWAKVWDPFLKIAGLDRKYREEGISALDLAAGMTVLDVACGTGFNFPFLVEAVGPKGRVIALDISQGMLTKAKERAHKNGWKNIEFIQGDVCQIRLPRSHAAAAFWCTVSIPDYQRAMDNIVNSLLPEGNLAILDFKPIDGFPGIIFNPIFAHICRVTHQNINREPWIYLETLLNNVQMRQWKLGGLLLANVYLAWGQKK
jgi:ubiquinone/menaquinone biosynthesis C-methylase UbiE